MSETNQARELESNRQPPNRHWGKEILFIILIGISTLGLLVLVVAICAFVGKAIDGRTEGAIIGGSVGLCVGVGIISVFILRETVGESIVLIGITGILAILICIAALRYQKVRERHQHSTIHPCVPAPQ
ncbi:hypothetical protein [Fimbriiglobus ruber]|uniref:hypothetical protein n=1 Tax=Fimbriiglobus ruber TaxID=1908690 RepID=UPI00137A4830|nr:hypothetical protein [Fimbriiglobus ruber]